jgi:hypothetical protein
MTDMWQNDSNKGVLLARFDAQVNTARCWPCFFKAAQFYQLG